jgi:hypothetical protein
MDYARDRAAPRPRLELPASEPDLHRDGIDDAGARPHLVGSGRARAPRHLSGRRSGCAGPRRGVRQGHPAPERPGQGGGDQVHGAGRDAGCRASVHPHYRPPARALAHRRDDAARDRARRARAGRGGSRGEIAKLGIAPGDRIRVSTRRGTVELVARQDDGVPFIPFAFVEAAANLLTNPALDPFGKIPEFKYCAAKVERAEDATQVAAE